MANDFKRFTKANITTSTGASADALYTVASSGSAMSSIVIGVTLANTSTSGVLVSVFLDNYDATNDVYIAKDVSIPAGSSLEIMQGNKLVVEGNGTNNDIIRVSSNTSNSVDATISVLEDV